MNFQTIEEFIARPFGNEEKRNNEFESKYSKLNHDKRISLIAYTQIDDDYLLHLSVGSDTNPTESYDVVLLFFTDDESIKKEITFKNYYVKFFSNSPSFIYQYAVLYKQNGFLIDILYDKMDAKYKDVLPDKVNKDHNMSYDKSIFCACKYILSHQAAFNKYLNFTPKKSPDTFFRGIKDFSDVKMISEIRSMDKKINKELEENKKRQKDEKRKRRGKNSTLSEGGITIKSPKTKVGSKRSTSGLSRNKTSRTVVRKTVAKKGAKRSTLKK